MRILGIESSCDETAAAVVENGTELLSSVISSSIDKHIAFGGVVPEIAARSHIEVILPIVHQALTYADCSWDDIDAIAVTYGAGLGGSLLVGVLSARTLAILHNKPLYPVNHVLAHVYANFINSSNGIVKIKSQLPEFPLLALIVSGGHTQLVHFESHFDYQILGRTRDDAIGEAFDKIAKILGLPYPGGPSIANLAKNGDPFKYKLPIARMDGYDFSFSGPKTAVLRLAQQLIGEDYGFPSTKLSERLTIAQKQDIAASFQQSVVDTVVNRTAQAFEAFTPSSVLLAGGVAANSELRRILQEKIPIPIQYPESSLCTDNGAMVASLGYFEATLNQPAADAYSLDIAPNLSM